MKDRIKMIFQTAKNYADKKSINFNPTPLYIKDEKEPIMNGEFGYSYIKIFDKNVADQLKAYSYDLHKENKHWLFFSNDKKNKVFPMKKADTMQNVLFTY